MDSKDTDKLIKTLRDIDATLKDLVRSTKVVNKDLHDLAKAYEKAHAPVNFVQQFEKQAMRSGDAINIHRNQGHDRFLTSAIQSGATVGFVESICANLECDQMTKNGTTGHDSFVAAVLKNDDRRGEN